MSRILLSSVAAVAALASAHGAAAQTEIQWWHAMGGALGEAVAAMTDQFNKSQSEYKVNAGLQGLLSRDHDGSDRRLPRQAGTAHRAGVRGRHRHHDGRQGRGLSGLQADGGQKEPFDPKAFIGPVYGYYSTTDGKLLSMPFNSSTPVFYWNKDAVQESRARSQHAAQDLDGSGRCGRQAGRLGRQVRTYLRMADLDPAREFRRLAQLAVRHQGQRFRRRWTPSSSSTTSRASS